MKRFIIFRTDRLGDFLIITNIIKAIKKKYKESHITIVGSPYNKKLINSYKNINKVLVYDKNSKISNKITIFKQKMFYYKLNLLHQNFIWYGSKICKKKHLISPQWLRNVKTRKYPIWRPDLLLSNKKYNNIEIIQDGGWHFTNIKSAEEIHHKMTNFLHHYEYQNSGLNSEDIKKLIERKKALYNYAADQRENKWKNNPELVKIALDNLPSYISRNKKKFESWID